MPWTRACGVAATRRVVPSVATITTPHATQPANPSSPSLGLPVDRPAWIRSRKLGCSGGRTPRAAYREPQRDRRRTDQEAARQSVRTVWRIATVCVRCRIRSRAIAERDGGLERSTPGEAAGRTLLLRRPCRAARTGRPRRHGPKMDTGNPQTWPEPSEEHRCEDPSYGLVHVCVPGPAYTRRRTTTPRAGPDARAP
jgi:hypothetical protein